MITFAGRNFRRVRLHVNVSDQTPLNLQLDGGEIRLLTVVPTGLSTVEFMHGGSFGVWPDRDVEVWYQTAEDEPTSVKSVGESFTTIHQRPARNLELERIMFVQEQNQRKREAHFMAQIEALVKGKSDGGKTGIHGGKAPEHPEPKKEAAKAAQGGDGASPQGEAQKGGAPSPAPAPGGSKGDGEAGGEAGKGK